MNQSATRPPSGMFLAVSAGELIEAREPPVILLLS
jgi:hypothetical protein